MRQVGNLSMCQQTHGLSSVSGNLHVDLSQSFSVFHKALCLGVSSEDSVDIPTNTICKIFNLQSFHCICHVDACVCVCVCVCVCRMVVMV